jgi:nicotinate-nucleotide adenylyltransferase
MLEAALKKDPTFELSRVEIDRPGPHYAVDTVKLLREEYPDDELIYLMGGDSLSDLPVNWYKPHEFVAECDYLGVMRRPKDYIDLEDLEAELPGLTAKVQFMDAPLLEIASRQIRRRVAQGRPYRYYLPEPVYEIIQARNLYKDHPAHYK